MRKKIIIAFCISLAFGVLQGQNKNATESRASVVKTDNTWNKSVNENIPTTNIQYLPDGVSYSTKSDGIFLILPKATSNVKLYSLTGEAVWSGNLVQGKFFIPTKAGIYFLRINNKSYKVICK